MNVYPFLILTLILLMFPGFCFSIGNQFINLYIPFIVLSIFMLLFFKCNPLKKHFFFLYKKTPYKYFIWFTLFSVITIIFSIFNGTFYFGGLITSAIGGLLCSVILPFIFASFLFSKILSTKFLIKFLYVFCWFVFVFALFEFLVYSFDIDFLKEIVSIFTNKRSIFAGTDLTYRVSVNNIVRVKSIFEEPSYLGYFILLLSPIIYQIHNNVQSVFNNRITNLIIKKTIIPFMWISLILTQSPIFLLFNIIFTVYYLLKFNYLFKFIQKHLLTIIIFITAIMPILIIYIDVNSIKFEQTYLYRIYLVLQNFNNFDDFVIQEQSLATRIIVFICGIQLFISTYGLGVGYGNLSYIIPNVILNSKLPLTTELQKLYFESNTHLTSTIFTKILTETGIIGFVIFYYFIYKTYSLINMMSVQMSSNLKFILTGFKLFVMLYILTSIYDSNLNQAWCWVIWGIIYSFIIKAKRLDLK